MHYTENLELYKDLLAVLEKHDASISAGQDQIFIEYEGAPL